MGESVTVPDPANDWLDCAGAVLRTQQDRERLQLVSALENVGARHLVDPHRSDWSDLTMQSRGGRVRDGRSMGDPVVPPRIAPEKLSSKAGGKWREATTSTNGETSSRSRCERSSTVETTGLMSGRSVGKPPR